MRKDSLSGRDDDEAEVPLCPMLPVKGARWDSALDNGSSKSFKSAVGKNAQTIVSPVTLAT